ncbi:MAG: winged helix-turn-helix domain-containing protein [Planctomycetota bacterium]
MLNQIGNDAGKIWQTLAKDGPMSLKQLERVLSFTPAEAHLAMGWLARENKVNLLAKGKNIYADLTETEHK